MEAAAPTAEVMGEACGVGLRVYVRDTYRDGAGRAALTWRMELRSCERPFGREEALRWQARVREALGAWAGRRGAAHASS